MTQHLSEILLCSTGPMMNSHASILEIIQS